MTHEAKQTPVMSLIPPEQRQAVSNQMRSTLQMMADMDLKIYGEIKADTLESVQVQGFVLQDGIVQKSEQVKTGQCEQTTLSVTRKASVRDQLHTAIKKADQHNHSADRTRGSGVR